MSRSYGRFEDLNVWQMAREWRSQIYQVTEGWPKTERYGLTAQIRDAAVSVTANIAEGHGRYHYLDNVRFCHIARGSVNEILDHLYAALDQGYLSPETFERLYAKGRHIERALNGYIRHLRGEPRRPPKDIDPGLGRGRSAPENR